MECSAQEAELNEGPGLLLDTQLRMGCRWDSPAEPPGSALFYIKKISASVSSIILISIQSMGKEKPASQSVW